MSKDEKMDRFNSKIASASEKNKLKEIKSRKVRPSSIDAITETLQAGDEAYDEVRRETRGAVPKNPFKSGGMVSASKRADGCAVKGKTRGRMV
jgi:hypothetical protein